LRLSAGLIAAALWVGVCGCARQKPPGTAPPDTSRAPDAQRAIGAYNARVGHIARLTTPLTLVIDHADPGDPSSRERDQVEGSFQYARPGNVSLRVDKVGQTLMVLGCNADRYWWFDFSGDTTLYVGSMRLASPEKARELGLPVHPLDLLDLACLTPLPSTSRASWDSSTGLVRIVAPSRWGGRSVLVDPETFEPRQVTLIDADGRGAVTAEVSRVEGFEVAGNAFSGAAFPTLIRAVAPAADAKFSLELTAPKDPGERMRTKPFDLDALIDAYRPSRTVDLDAPRGEP